MLHFCENDFSTQKPRRRGRSEILNSLYNSHIPSTDEIINLKYEKSDPPLFDESLQNRKSLDFPIVKKWTSPRLRSVSIDGLDKSDEDQTSCDLAESPKTRTQHKILNSYGHIEGVKIGDWWSSRIECSYAGVHRPTFASVHAGRDGAYSLAVSNCNIDGEDSGSHFVYTGSGSRDLRGTKYNSRDHSQPKNNVIDNSNISLVKSVESGNPVRVIRGYKMNSGFAPLRGYRYDGLYTVEKFWTCKGVSGFSIFKFLMKRCQDQSPAPWEFPSSPSRNPNSSIKKSTIQLEVMDDSVNQYQAISSQNEESVGDNKDSGYADDNKENSTFNIANKLLCDEFTSSSSYNGSIFLSSDILLPCSSRNVRRKNERSNKRRLHHEIETNKSLKKFCKRSVKTSYEIQSNCTTRGMKDLSEPFKGFGPEHCPRKMILLGFLIHDMQSKLTKN